MTVNHEKNLDPEEKENNRRDPPLSRNGIIERTPFPKPRWSKPIFHRTSNMTYPLSIPPCSKKSFPIECTEVPQQPTVTTRSTAVAQMTQYYIATNDSIAFQAIIGAQIEIGEAPPGDGRIPFDKMQTADGEDILVLPVSTRLLCALHRWNRKNVSQQFPFITYQSRNGSLLQPLDVKNSPAVAPKENSQTKKMPPPRSALAPRPRTKKI